MNRIRLCFVLVLVCELICLSEESVYLWVFQHMWVMDFLRIHCTGCILYGWAPCLGHCTKQWPKGPIQNRNAGPTWGCTFTHHCLLIILAWVTGLQRFTSDLLLACELHVSIIASISINAEDWLLSSSFYTIRLKEVKWLLEATWLVDSGTTTKP